MKLYTAFLLLGLVAYCYAGKEGLAWGDWDTSNLAALAGNGLKPSWIYTWSPWNINQQAGLELIPMFHDPGSATDFVNAFNAGVWAHSSAILFLNEPDINGVSPATAVSLWKQYMQPRSSFRLGSPVVASNTNGKSWLQQFMSQCSGCKIDFVPLHWYGSNANAFISYVQDMHNTFGRNVWITEWACVQYSSSDPDCSQNNVYSFMGQTTLWLDQQSYVERWAWFGALKNVAATGVPATNALLTSDGQSRTGLGNQYASVGGHA